MVTNSINTLRAGKLPSTKGLKLPNTSTGKTTLKGVTKSVSKKPASPTAKGRQFPKLGDGMKNIVPPTPVADKISTGMRHSALSADGKSKVSGARHLPKPQTSPVSAPFG